MFSERQRASRGNSKKSIDETARKMFAEEEGITSDLG